MWMNRKGRTAGLLVAVPALALALLGAASVAPAHAAGATSLTHQLLITSATENADFTQATFPLHMGLSDGKPVWYVITDASDSQTAARLGVNYAPKLRNVIGTGAVQRVTYVGNSALINFPATVDFSLTHILVPGPNGFPPAQAQPGAVGEPGYSPLIELPNGVVLDAPQVANLSGRADKVIAIGVGHNTVTYHETMGFYDFKPVHYASFEASDPGAAAIEDVTYAPALNAAPSLGDESSQSAREGLIAFINGQTGVDNPQRQGLNSAILDQRDPLNILHEIPPENNDYSPLWEPHLVAWQPGFDKTRQTDYDQIVGLIGSTPQPIAGVAVALQIQGDPAPFGPAGFVVTCPPISRDN
jgi:hypothetical protein